MRLRVLRTRKSPVKSNAGYKLILDREKLKDWVRKQGLDSVIDLRLSLNAIKEHLDTYFKGTKP